MRLSNIIAIVLILAMAAIAVYVYPQMPERVASHWNAQGAADGSMPKFWGLFLLPMVTLLLILLLAAIPRIDPLRHNIESFRPHYDWFVALFAGFMCYVHLLTVLWNIGIRYDMVRMLCPAMGVLFFYSGVMLGHARRNYFIGIRTPWTLQSEAVWDKTHRLGAKQFKIAGVLCLGGMFLKDWGLLLVLVPVLAFSIYLFGYSYREYQKEQKPR